MTEISANYTKAHPFQARITERYNLCLPGSEKKTYHVVVSLHGSGIIYTVGDSIAVQPTNDPDVVAKTLRALKASGAEIVAEKHSGIPISLKDALLKKCNLAEVPRKLITALAQRQDNPQKKEHLEFILSEGQKEALKGYQNDHEVWDALAENHEVLIEPQELCQMLQPLLPRFYSIASSMAAAGEEVHLTVAELQYETNSQVRRGVCTHYLCSIAPLNTPVVPIYLQPSHGFTVPESKDAAMIMIGPGTGIAPYRGFMQERLAQQATGPHWLFFGECHRATEYFYEEYWQQLIAKGMLQVDTAFSRDQEHKIYVQHRMLEKGKELFDWLENGAYLYVCGDAHRMAKDVDAALHRIVQQHAHVDEAGAKEYIKKLKTEKRYLRDVY